MALDHLPADSLPREKLLARGPAALSDAELLALLLRTGTAGRNVLVMAQDVLDACGGVGGLLQASAGSLARIKGLGGTAKRAELLAVMELARRALAQRLAQREVMNESSLARDYLQMQIGHLPHECFAVLFLDAQHRMIECETLFRGTIDQTSVYPREVALRALHHHAASVVLAHNHPSGTLTPSEADIALTRHLSQALGLLDIRVLDHIIVGRGQALSMAEQGLMPAG